MTGCPAAAGLDTDVPGCINCGVCLQRCPTSAIGYADDTERFMRDVVKGEPISLLVAPAVCNNFIDYRKLFGYLKTLGVRSFHNVLLRADITIWAYVELMRRDKKPSFLSSPCAAVSEYVRRYMPSLRQALMPVYSPLLCTVVYLKKYQNVHNRLAFLSPCIAKRREIQAGSPGGYNITIGRLKQYIAAQGINLSDYEPADFDDAAEGNGLTLGTYGGLSECIAAYFPEHWFMKISGPDKVYPWLAEYEQAVREGQKLPALVELYNCTAGCEGGTGVGEYQNDNLRAIHDEFPAGHGLVSSTHYQATEDLFAKFHRNLNLADFIRSAT
jgi:iron only hydrogenase large subunit-like protein